VALPHGVCSKKKEYQEVSDKRVPKLRFKTHKGDKIFRFIFSLQNTNIFIYTH
jgi:hypothetical protein